MQPFDKHTANVGQLEQCGSDLVNQSAQAILTGTATRTAYAPAIANWDGLCAPELTAAQNPVQNSSQEAQSALAWGAVVTQYWAAQVRDFNAEVDRITAGLNGQGPSYGATGTGGQPATATQVNDAKNAATGAAKQKWWTAYNSYITDGGTKAASMLKQGPTDANVAEAQRVGALPGMQFAPWTYWLASLQGMYTIGAGPLGSVPWWVGTSMRPIGPTAGWLSKVQWGRFAPRGPDGRFIAIADAGFWAPAKGANWIAKPGMSGLRGGLLTGAKWAGRAGNVLAVGTAALDQWSRDSGRTDLSTDEKVGRAATRGAIGGGGAIAGAIGGAEAGAAIGTLVGGPVGTVVGGFVGGMVGGIIGGGVGNAVADHVVAPVGHAIGKGLDAIGDAGKSVGHFFGSLF
ncbi:hypothetical protein [Fodinicola feengrottensis]|uniref:Uncharacterized protein n=1 Tax=Fodinicola feengrottensis TaxID=435914 RepID=A0ABN2GA99_9ACTN|nr:hypothetical protein [Fodinicola feengrottensis]